MWPIYSAIRDSSPPPPPIKHTAIRVRCTGGREMITGAVNELRLVGFRTSGPGVAANSVNYGTEMITSPKMLFSFRKLKLAKLDESRLLENSSV